MHFINKWACMAAHVLVYEDCPPHDTMHETDDYPMYYDALYFPELHLSMFKTLETVKAWLLVGSVHQWSKLILTSSMINDMSLTSTMYSKQTVLFYQPQSRLVQTPKMMNLVPGLDSSFLCANSWQTECSFCDEL